MISKLLNSGLSFEVGSNGRLIVKGPKSVVDELKPTIQRLKLELLKIVAGEVVSNVGSCDDCTTDLIGFPVFDGYTNRVCPNCGKWHSGLPPKKLRAAVREHADIDCDAFTHQLEEQKAISQTTERMYKDGRRSWQTDDRVTQLKGVE